MPGINYVTDISTDSSPDDGAAGIIPHLYDGPGYTHTVLYEAGPTALVFGGYTGYPLHTIDTGNCFCVLEGHLYGWDEAVIEKELRALARDTFENKNRLDAITDWNMKVDGEFVLIMIEKLSGDTIIANGYLGLLPLYMHRNGGRFAVCREIGAFGVLGALDRFDRMALAQTLLFAFPLGTETVFEGIRRVPPGSIITVTRQTGDINVTPGRYRNFDHEEDSGGGAGKAAEHLAGLFVDGVKARSSTSTMNVVALSGGLDSRVVAAALSQTGAPARAISFLDIDRTAIRDVELAEEIAATVGIPWEKYDLTPPTGIDAGMLLRQKYGSNVLTMSFMMPFLRYLRKTSGSNAVMYTGDGGDKVITDIRPVKHLRSVEDMADFIISIQGTAPLETVSALTGLDTTAIRNDLRERLHAYPEKQLDRKYVHFLVYERAFKGMLEGEDRNRYTTWSTAPFYSRDFFYAATQLPWRLKTRYKFYRIFLDALSPEVATFANENWRLPVNSRLVSPLLFTRSMLYRIVTPAVQRGIHRLLKHPEGDMPSDPETIAGIRRQFATTPVLRDWFPIEPDDLDRYLTTRISAHYFFTLTSLMELVFRGRTVFDDHPDARFF